MAKKNGKKSAKQPSLHERLLKVEEEQRRLEAELEESQSQINKVVDRQDKHVRRFNQQMRDIAAMLRTMGERAMIIHELQEKAELRLDKHEERMADLTDQQAETTRKLNALLDYEKRYRSNGQNGKKVK